MHQRSHPFFPPFFIERNACMLTALCLQCRRHSSKEVSRSQSHMSFPYISSMADSNLLPSKIVIHNRNADLTEARPELRQIYRTSQHSNLFLLQRRERRHTRLAPGFQGRLVIRMGGSPCQLLQFMELSTVTEGNGRSGLIAQYVRLTSLEFL